MDFSIFTKRVSVIITLLTLILFNFNASAQLKNLTMEDAILGGGPNGKFAPKNLSNLEWRNNTEYSYLSMDGKKVVLVDALTSIADTIARLETIKTFITNKTGREIKSLKYLGWISNEQICFRAGSYDYFYSVTKHTLESEKYISDKAENIDFNQKTLRHAYTLGDGLYVDGILVDPDTAKGIVYGKAVHRNEWGIKSGTFWSPSGKLLAFYRMDERMVTDYPIVHIDSRPAKVDLIKYPMAGMKSHEVTVGVYNPEKKSIIYLNTGLPKDKFLTNVCWSPDNKYIFIQELNRAQNEMSLNQYNAENGEFVKTLYGEKHPKYVEPLYPLYFFNDHQYLFISAKSGYRHFYIGDIDHPYQLKQFTTGDWQIVDILGVNESNTAIYYTSTQFSPTSINAYKLNIPKKINVLTKNILTPEIKMITGGLGMHQAVVSKDGKYVIDKYSNTTTPRKIDIRNCNSGEIESNVLTALNPLNNINLGQMRLFTIKAGDGKTDLKCRMFLPTNFDSTKKYKAVVYVYGGPHAQMITDGWLGGANLWFQYMAERGYIMFTLDNRGSMNRGQDFEQITHKQLGTIEMEDQLLGLKYLKNLKYVDSNKVGVHGWSFGGFMTTSLMTRTPWAFKVGVAGGPVIDWSYYEIMYGERYMGTPISNEVGYNKNNLLNYTQNLKGKLLMIHGGVDDVVVMQHSMMYIKKCVDNNIQLDYFIYSEHPHNVLGKDRVHLMQKISDYFDMYLK